MSNFKSDLVPAVPGFIRPELVVNSDDIYASYAVRGFWGTPVSIHLHRDYRSDTWSFRAISNSSGGQECNVTVAQRARNLAAALNDAAEWADEIDMDSSSIEREFQVRRKQQREQRAERSRLADIAKEEHDRRVEADPALGSVAAKNMLSEAREAYLEDGKSSVIATVNRGINTTLLSVALFRPVFSGKGPNRIFWLKGSLRKDRSNGGHVISWSRNTVTRKDVLSRLSNASDRSRLLVAETSVEGVNYLTSELIKFIGES